tara:strand:- start:495 stop:1622 length:1128 start_codon:yes stop_codon:yes gene_type:complete
MTRQVWKIEKFSSDKTDDVMSFTYSTGRRTQFDTYAPGSLILTIRNNTNQADGYQLNDKIILTAVGTTWYQWHYVQEVIFNDEPGTGTNSTATIICTDLLGRCGRIQVFEEAIAQAQTLQQIATVFDPLLPASTSFVLFGQTLELPGATGESTAAADASYSGTALNRLNLNMTTEQGRITVSGESIKLYSRSSYGLFPANITFARTTSGTFQIGYSNIERIALGPNYLNNCTVTPPVAAAQNAIDSSGVSTYGTYGGEFSTVDSSATQAQDFAQYQVVSRADPEELSFAITVSDTANDLTDLLDSLLIYAYFNVSYKKPGSGSAVTESQILQGWSMSVTPAGTTMQIFTSPAAYSSFFLLDSGNYGLLDIDHLGW